MYLETSTILQVPIFLNPSLLVKPCRFLAAPVQFLVILKVFSKSTCAFVFHQLTSVISDPLMVFTYPNTHNCFSCDIVLLSTGFPEISFFARECGKAILYFNHVLLF